MLRVFGWPHPTFVTRWPVVQQRERSIYGGVVLLSRVTCHVSRVTWYKVMLGSEVLRSCTLKMLFRGKIFTRKIIYTERMLGSKLSWG